MDRIQHDAVIVAIGDNYRRRELYLTLSKRNFKLAVVCHPETIISQFCGIGDGSQIIAGTIINAGTKIGNNTIINTGCTIDHHCLIGDHVHIAPGVNIGGEVIIEDDVFVGIGSIIAPRCRIGVGAQIGAGSMVLRDVEGGDLVYGSPAKSRRN